MHRAKDNLDVAMRENSVISMEKGYQQTYQGFNPRSSESYIIFEFIQGKNMERSVELARNIQRRYVPVPTVRIRVCIRQDSWFSEKPRCLAV